jgi:hypothetical protein
MNTWVHPTWGLDGKRTLESGVLHVPSIIFHPLLHKQKITNVLSCISWHNGKSVALRSWVQVLKSLLQKCRKRLRT